MRIFLFVFLMLFSCLAQATVQTETHTYILSRHDNKLLVIDRKTDEEKVLEVGKNPTSFLINEGIGYVVNRDSKFITVINLTIHEVEGKILLNSEPFNMTIYKKKGYVFCDGGAGVYVVDLCLNKVESSINLSSGSQNMVVHNDLGYVSCMQSNTVWVINLSTNKSLRAIHTVYKPCFIKVYGSTGFVIGQGSCITVLNLETQEVIDSITLQSGLRDFLIQGKRGYGLQWGTWGTEGRLVVIDLETHKILKIVELGVNPITLCFYKGKGYIIGNNSDELIIINLVTFEYFKKLLDSSDVTSMTIHNGTGFISCKNRLVSMDLMKDLIIHSDRNPFDHFMHDVAFSDTHMYLGVRRLIGLPLRLFDDPYLGIEGPLFGDADLAFDKFQSAGRVCDFLNIMKHFKEALALGHSKAYAVAAYAFLFSQLGAVDNNDDHWFVKFFKDADKSYFQNLIQTEGTCMWGEDALIKETAGNLNKLTERERSELFSMIHA